MQGPNIDEIKTFTAQLFSDEVQLVLEQTARKAIELVEHIDKAKMIDGRDLEIIIRACLLSAVEEGFTKQAWIDMLAHMGVAIGVLDCLYIGLNVHGDTFEAHIVNVADSNDRNAIMFLMAIVKQSHDANSSSITKDWLQTLAHHPLVIEMQEASERLPA